MAVAVAASADAASPTLCTQSRTRAHTSTHTQKLGGKGGAGARRLPGDARDGARSVLRDAHRVLGMPCNSVEGHPRSPCFYTHARSKPGRVPGGPRRTGLRFTSALCRAASLAVVRLLCMTRSAWQCAACTRLVDSGYTSQFLRTRADRTELQQPNMWLTTSCGLCAGMWPSSGCLSTFSGARQTGSRCPLLGRCNRELHRAVLLRGGPSIKVFC